MGIFFFRHKIYFPNLCPLHPDVFRSHYLALYAEDVWFSLRVKGEHSTSLVMPLQFPTKQVDRFPQSLDLVAKRTTTIPTLKKLARQLPGKLVDDRRLGLGNCKGKKKKAAFKFRRCPYSYNHFFIRHEVREKWALYTKCFCWCHENCENYTSVDCYLSALVL